MFLDIHSAKVDINNTKPEPRRPPKSDLSMPDIVLFYTQKKASQRLANIVRNFIIPLLIEKTTTLLRLRIGIYPNMICVDMISDICLNELCA